MRRVTLSLLFLVGALAFVCVQDAKAQEKMSCVVGKNIKVYSNYNKGRVVSNLKKGTKVYWLDEIGGDGTSWAKVGLSRGGKYVSLGWVVFGYGLLKCNWP